MPPRLACAVLTPLLNFLVSSRGVVGSMVLATAAIARTMAWWPLVASAVAQHPACVHCTSRSFPQQWHVVASGKELAAQTVSDGVFVNVWW